MKSIHRVGILVFILGAVLSSAQAQDFSSGGFDLTPVQSPSIVKGAKRPITSMDLLTIRDAKGVSISPDGKRVVFIVGQVAYATNNYHSGLFVMSTAPGSVPVALGTAGASLLDEIN